jgi:hypothetical protein
MLRGTEGGSREAARFRFRQPECGAEERALRGTCVMRDELELLRDIASQLELLRAQVRSAEKTLRVIAIVLAGIAGMILFT